MAAARDHRSAVVSSRLYELLIPALIDREAAQEPVQCRSNGAASGSPPPESVAGADVDAKLLEIELERRRKQRQIADEPAQGRRGWPPSKSLCISSRTARPNASVPTTAYAA